MFENDLKLMNWRIKRTSQHDDDDSNNPVDISYLNYLSVCVTYYIQVYVRRL